VLERAVRLNPGNESLAFALAGELALAGREEEALPYFAASTRADTPDQRWAIAHTLVGRALLSRQQAAAARAHFEEAARLDPASPEVHFSFGLSAELEGRPAAAHYEAALRLDPAHPMVNTQYGLLRLREGKPADALPLFQRAVVARPDSPIFRMNLATALTALGRMEEARREYDEATRLAPNWPWGAVRSAWESVTGGRGTPAEAVLLARQACEATGFRRPDFLVVLAAALAADGQFAAAIGWLDRAEPAAGPRLQERIKAHRELYRAGASLRGRPEPFPELANVGP
jgi:Flp pilus assembly protein TadD